MAHKIERLWIEGPAGAMKLLVLGQREDGGHPGVLWIHGGGYRSGMPEMAFFSRAADLVRYFHAVVVTPEYRLSGTAPYPAALDDRSTQLSSVCAATRSWSAARARAEV